MKKNKKPRKLIKDEYNLEAAKLNSKCTTGYKVLLRILRRRIGITTPHSQVKECKHRKFKMQIYVQNYANMTVIQSVECEKLHVCFSLIMSVEQYLRCTKCIRCKEFNGV